MLQSSAAAIQAIDHVITGIDEVALIAVGCELSAIHPGQTPIQTLTPEPKARGTSESVQA